MSATKTDIQQWVEEGVKRGATHVIIALDTWDYENYPVYVQPGESVKEQVDSYQSKEDRIDEVYNLSLNIEEQLNQRRVWNL